MLEIAMWRACCDYDPVPFMSLRVLLQRGRDLADCGFIAPCRIDSCQLRIGKDQNARPDCTAILRVPSPP
jgi:hypothetical protein